VEPADQPRPKPLPAGTSKRDLNLGSLGLLVASAVLLIAVLVANFQSEQVVLALRISLTGALFVFALLLADVIRKIRQTERHAQTVFEDTEQDFHQMAINIQEIFWVIDAETKQATFVNPAYETDEYDSLPVRRVGLKTRR
jgi:hypothetical protein